MDLLEDEKNQSKQAQENVNESDEDENTSASSILEDEGDPGLEVSGPVEDELSDGDPDLILEAGGESGRPSRVLNPPEIYNTESGTSYAQKSILKSKVHSIPKCRVKKKVICNFICEKEQVHNIVSQVEGKEAMLD